MSTDYTAQKAATAIASALSQHDLSDAEKSQIREIIETSLVNAVELTTKNHLKTTVACCGPEADLAHKISHEVNLKKKALISNLMGLR